MNGFILTRSQQDTDTGILLEYWLATEMGPVLLQYHQQRRICFFAKQDLPAAKKILETSYSTTRWEIKTLNLQCFSGQPAIALYTLSNSIGLDIQHSLKAHGIPLMEADIRPHERFLMERFITGAVHFDYTATSTSINSTPSLPDTQSIKRKPIVNAPLKPADYIPKLRALSLDIETTMDAKTIHSIAVYGYDVDPAGVKENQRLSQPPSAAKVWLHWPLKDTVKDLPDYVQRVPNERQMLRQWVHWINEYDPDVIIGWNLVQFDFQVIYQRAQHLGVRLCLGRGGETLQWWPDKSGLGRRRNAKMFIAGRAVLDGIEVMRSATWQFESFALSHVAQQLLGRDKAITPTHDRGAEIQRMYREQPSKLAIYNLEDCRLVYDIFIKADLFEFVIVRSQLTGLALDHMGGSIKAFDHLYLPRLHRQGYVAPAFASGMIGDSPGGFVMNSLPGLYKQVLVLDFKSLYPSIIRSFLIDPLGLIKGIQENNTTNTLEKTGHQITEPPALPVPGYKQACFSRKQPILPDIIANLWRARDQAKAKNNHALSTAIKIVMNSCYGVLGSDSCRFYDQRLASSITERGHFILKQTQRLIEAQGYPVIYGDTDSVFVWVGDKGLSLPQAREIGTQLAQHLNNWWQAHLKNEYALTSYLEIEFETLFKHFVMPTMRGTQTGSKKRYAGLVSHADGKDAMLFKGLEHVRTDWTMMAREFQMQLYTQFFAQQEYVNLIINTEQAIRNGQMDAQLVYRKRIRQPLASYTKNTPPHIKAAKQAEQWLLHNHLPSRYAQGGWIEYVISLQGPQALDIPNPCLDYDHYIDKQLKPIVDGLLTLADDSYDRIMHKQMGLF